MKKILLLTFFLFMAFYVKAQNSYPTPFGPATINYDDGAALRIQNWNRFGSTNGGHYPYWGMNVHHTSNGWTSFHPTLRGSLILNFGNKTFFSSVPANTSNASLTHHMVVDNVNDRIGIGTDAPSARLDILGETFDQAITDKVVAFRLKNIYNEPERHFKNAAVDFVLSRWEAGGNHRPETQLDFKLAGNANETYDDHIPNVDVMTLRSDGRVGVGTTTPQQLLHVSSSSNDVGLQVETTGNNVAGIELKTNSNTDWQIAAGGTAATRANDFYIYDRGANVSRFLITESGNVGIGTSTPSPHNGSNALVVAGPNSGTTRGIIELWDGVSGKSVFQNVGGDTYVGQLDKGNGSGKLILLSGGTGTTAHLAMVIDATGNTVIDGELESKKIRVSATPGNWPDYVFESDYSLTPLSQLEQYVNTHKHLPEVPSAKEVEANGQDLGDIQATLLKKVEELTLYTIDQDKNLKQKTRKIEALEQENAEMKALFLELKKEIEQLKNKDRK